MSVREEIDAIFLPLTFDINAAYVDALVELQLTRVAIEDRWAAQVDALTVAASRHTEEIAYDGYAHR